MSAFFRFSLVLLFGCALSTLQYAAAGKMNINILLCRTEQGDSPVAGSNLELCCGVDGPGKASVSWWKGVTKLSDGNSTLTNDSRVSVTFRAEPEGAPLDGFSRLLIKNLRVSDAGQYTCGASSLDGSKSLFAHHGGKTLFIHRGSTLFTYPYDVKVDYKPFSGPLEFIDIPEGNTFSFSCNVTGDSKPAIKWMLEHPHDGSGRRALPQFNNMQNITIPKMNYTDAGWYSCVVDNSTGDPSIATVVSVGVQYPPKFADHGILLDKRENTSYARIGGRAYLQCDFAVNPPGNHTLKWFYKHSEAAEDNDAAEIAEDDRHEIRDFYSEEYHRIIASLEIKSVQKVDLRKYICAAKNKMGSAESEQELLRKDAGHRPTVG